MFCGFCGEKLNKSDKFCLNCGEATSQSKPVEAEKPALVPYSSSKDEVIEQKSVEEESDREPLFGFLKSTGFWKVIGFAVIILLVFIPSAIYLTSNPDSENIVAVVQLLHPPQLIQYLLSQLLNQVQNQKLQVPKLQKLLSRLPLKLKQCFAGQLTNLVNRNNVLN